MDCLQCVICHQRSANFSSFRKHLRTHPEYVHTTANFQVSCPNCPATSFNSLKTYFQHIGRNIRRQEKLASISLPAELHLKRKRGSSDSSIGDLLEADIPEARCSDENANSAVPEQQDCSQPPYTFYRSPSSYNEQSELCKTLTRYVSMLRCKSSCTERNIDAAVNGISNIFDSTFDLCIQLMNRHISDQNELRAAASEAIFMKRAAAEACNVSYFSHI